MLPRRNALLRAIMYTIWLYGAHLRPPLINIGSFTLSFLMILALHSISVSSSFYPPLGRIFEKYIVNLFIFCQKINI